MIPSLHHDKVKHAHIAGRGHALHWVFAVHGLVRSCVWFRSLRDELSLDTNDGERKQENQLEESRKISTKHPDCVLSSVSLGLASYLGRRVTPEKRAKPGQNQTLHHRENRAHIRASLLTASFAGDMGRNSAGADVARKVTTGGGRGTLTTYQRQLARIDLYLPSDQCFRGMSEPWFTESKEAAVMRSTSDRFSAANEGSAVADLLLGILLFIWCVVRVPILIVLAFLEPFVRLLLTGIAILSLLTGLVYKGSSAPPPIPF
jgi:hypothetical protein